jgi:uncharacterized membrane protein
MKSLNECINEYKKQIEKGEIQQAYKGLMEYMMNLRNQLAAKYPEYTISGSVYQGYMDMTYFSFTPSSLVKRKLKIALVLMHNKVGFEVWLAGANKQIQLKYHQLFKENKWNKYRMPLNIKNADSIIEFDLTDNPDFNDLESLTRTIELGIEKFTRDIVDFIEVIER